MVFENSTMTVLTRWRAMLIVFGVVLTIAWIVLLAWFPLYLLKII